MAGRVEERWRVGAREGDGDRLKDAGDAGLIAGRGAGDEGLEDGRMGVVGLADRGGDVVRAEGGRVGEEGERADVGRAGDAGRIGNAGCTGERVGESRRSPGNCKGVAGAETVREDVAHGCVGVGEFV